MKTNEVRRVRGGARHSTGVASNARVNRDKIDIIVPVPEAL
jgi:hypothetical protein